MSYLRFPMAFRAATEILFLALGVCFFPQVAYGQSANATPGAKVLATNLRGFGIPFRINADDQSYIEVQLYLSEDQGKTWRFHDRQSTDKAEFPFEAETDGEYWFALKTLNRNRQLLPEGKTEPELVIRVDTVKPELTFQIESDPAGRVACRWRAFDSYLDAGTLQILYQPIGSPADQWTAVPANFNGTVRNGLYADQVAWWPETTATALNVRLSIADAAGNLVQQDRRINIAPSPWRHRSSATARTGDANSSGQIEALPSQVPTPAHPPLESSRFSDQNPGLSGPSPDQTTQFKPDPLLKQNATSFSDSTHSNVVCENGVCRLKTTNPHFDPFAREGASPLKKQNLPRVAGLNNATARGLQVPLIGGAPEYADPPIPPGYVPSNRTASRPQYFQSQREYPAIDTSGAKNPANSVPWTSERERWTSRHQSSESTTLAPDPRMLPNPYTDQATPNRDLPPANPTSMNVVGDQVIGESSTIGATNQYRGLKPQSNPFVSPNFATSDMEPNQESRNRKTDPALIQADQENWQTGYGTGGTQQPTSQPSPSAREMAATNLTPSQHVAELSSDGASADRSPQQHEANFNSSVMMIGSKRFRLNYGIDAIDPSGVAKVDLWMTRDSGRTWTAWGSDPDNASPFPVEVTEEGRYGFRIVVHSKDGLTGRGPSSGDAADIWVEIDTQSPLAQIVSVPYGRGDEAGRLVINYRVVDPFLVLRPINIAYSRNPDGPWTAIGEGLRNDGRFVWKPESNVPDRIFLRLDARDRAGNVGVHQLSQAIDVSGLVPRGTIHGVIPVNQ